MRRLPLILVGAARARSAAAVTAADRPQKRTTTFRCRSRRAWRRRRRWAGTAGTSSSATSARTSSRTPPTRWCRPGMKDAGYQYINIDDCWSIESAARDAERRAAARSGTSFPRRHQADRRLTSRGLGLKLGIYGDRGSETCGHRAGSRAATRLPTRRRSRPGASNTSSTTAAPTPGRTPARRSAAVPGDARRADAAETPIVYSVCSWSFHARADCDRQAFSGSTRRHRDRLAVEA